MSKRKTIIMSNLGAGLEYYDYSTYAVLSPYIAQVFFPNSDYKAQLIKSILIFSIGAFARIIGSILFGIISDRFGRRNGMSLGMIVMGIATMSMGLLPTYHDIGITGTIMLGVCRFLQGMTFGSEVPSSVVFLTEYNSTKKAYGISLLNMSMSIGAIAANFMVYILNTLFTTDQILEFAWRIPLLLGGLVGIFGFFARTLMDESPEFLKSKQTQNISFMAAIDKKNILNMLWTILMIIMPSSLLITGLYCQAWLSKIFDYGIPQVSFYTTISLIAITLVNPIIGKALDRYGSKVGALCLLCILMIIHIPCLIAIDLYRSLAPMVVWLFVHQVMISSSFTMSMSVCSGLFPTRVKSTLFGVSANITSFACTGVPVLIISIGNVYGLIAILLIPALINIFTLYFLVNKAESNIKSQTEYR